MDFEGVSSLLLPRRVRLITDSSRKDDRLDAKTLARLARIDPELLSPIRHRSEQAQADLMVIRARAALVEVRTMLVNSARRLAKSYGQRLRSCGTGQVGEELAESAERALAKCVEPAAGGGGVSQPAEQIGTIGKSRYPEVELLQQVHGAGTLESITRDRAESIATIALSGM